MNDCSQEVNGAMIMSEPDNKMYQYDLVKEEEFSDEEHSQQGIDNILACFRDQQDEVLQKIAVSQEGFEKNIESISTIRFGTQTWEERSQSENNRCDRN